jgi:diguanylate cyclase (GGDEF)-like protein
LEQLRIEKVMTREVACVAANEPVRDILAKMVAGRVSCVVVCEDGVPLGLITERDVSRVAVNAVTSQGGIPAEAHLLMSSPVMTLSASDTLERALELSERWNIRHLPVIDGDGLLVGILTQTDLLRAYARGVERLVEKRTAELAEANERLEALSRKDGLLAIGNRRSMDESLVQVHDVATRYGRPYSLLLCDVDYFKAYNDTYGHPAGDEVLRRISDCIVRMMRKGDQVFRYGGEEILLVLPETEIAGAERMGQRICSAIRDLAMVHEASPLKRVTVSCGIFGVTPSETMEPTHGAAVKSTDQALYRAKGAGRDRFSV